ncbi:glycosyltransferase family 39 protein [Sporolactobacillus spathodeae]|uniref:Glycosyltransferase RgtA/B/C/D-like domain-containing protein n=1 Tax=Sporolactobacillus spathodeae TaxID=1465502 RepID=A0ABS2Q5V2_9BACL|nr:hypothetical protein [Sporolactobacillus spathodeae]
MKGYLRPWVIAFSIVNLVVLMLTIVACFIFPDYYWKMTGLYLGKYFHFLDIPIALFLFSLIYLLLLLLLMRAFKRMSPRQEKSVSLALWGVVILFELLIIALFHGILPPSFDGGHTYSQAIDMLKHRRTPGIMDYFQIYPNNISITIIRYWLYRYICLGQAHLFIYADQISSAMALNIAIYFAWRFIVSSQNRKMGHLFLILVLTCFPLFFYLTYFYTDSFALMFPSLVLYFVFRLTRTGQLKYLVYCAVLIAIGFQIRENIILMLPATIIYLLLVKKVKKALYLLLVTLILVTGFGKLAQTYEEQMGFHKNMALQMPVTSWMVLGTSDAGRYNKNDYLLSRNPSTQQKKESADIRVIQNRIKKDGLLGFSKIWAIKDARTFADGSIGYYWYTHNTSNYSVPYNYLFGNRKELIVYAIQGIHIVEWILFALAAIRLIRKRKYDENLYLQLCLFGSFLFYVIVWEAEPRYALLFTVLQLTGCIYGLQELYDLAVIFTRKAKNVRLYYKAGMLGMTGLLALTASIALKNNQTVTQIVDAKPNYVIDQSVSIKKTIAIVRATQQVKQTFTAKKPFKAVRFRVLKHQGAARYLASVTANGKSSRSVIGQKIVNSNRLKRSGHVTIPIHHWTHASNHRYTLTIKKLTGVPDSKLSLAMNQRGWYEQMDLYSGGALYLNDQIQHKKDLMFQVYTKGNHPYLSEPVYLTLLSIPLLILLIAMYRFRESVRKGSRGKRSGSSGKGMKAIDA